MSVIVPSPLYTADLFNPEFDNRVVPNRTWADDAKFELVEAAVSTQPVTENAATRQGTVGAGFGFLDYYNRIHFSDVEIGLGNVVSSQTRELRIFNSYFVEHQLQSVTSANADGVSLTQPAPPPLMYAPLQERVYAFGVSTEGPPTVDASFTFTFDVRAQVVSLTGSRITAWIWAPDWSRNIIERVEWLTDVLRAYSGKEQRVALRSGPRKEYEFAFSAEASARRRLENTLYGWGARVWALPIWTDGEDLAAPVYQGATSIPSDTDSRDYHADGLGIVFAGDGSDYEVFEIEAVDADEITLKRGIERTWPAGSRIFPARTARLEDRQAVSRFVLDFAYGVVRFQLVEPITHAAAVEAVTYRGHPVLTQRQEWSEDPELAYHRQLAEFDPRTGVRSLEDESGIPDTLQAYRWRLTSRDEIEAFRQFLYARAGRHKAIWIPTWTNDAVVNQTVASAATAIDVEDDSFVRFVNAGAHRKDLRIELTDGTVFYRRITGAQVIDDTTERLILDASFGRVIQPAEFRHVSFMALCRLDQDSVELAWSTGAQADAVAVFRAVNNDV